MLLPLFLTSSVIFCASNQIIKNEGYSIQTHSYMGGVRISAHGENNAEFGNVVFYTENNGMLIGEIYRLYVERSYRSQGYGSILVQAAIDALKKKECAAIKVKPFPIDSSDSEINEQRDRLKKFYARFGFKPAKNDFEFLWLWSDNS